MIRQEVTKTLELVGHCVQLFGQSMRYIPQLPQQATRVLDHAFNIGYRTFPIVAVMSVFIGSVLALQTGYSLGQIAGGQTFLGNIVGLSMCQELGPVMTAFLLSGRVGSAIAAELGSMKVYQEVDALQTMNIAPARILVLPRLIAVALMMPALTLMSIVIGWYGGALISHLVSYISLDYNVYWHGLRSTVEFRDIWDGLVKAEIFGIVVVTVCCSEGLRTIGGPREIGRSVTRAVVTSMVLVLLMDYFVTKVQL